MIVKIIVGGWMVPFFETQCASVGFVVIASR